MRYTKPKRLNKGDLIGLISPASTPDDLSRINSGTKYLEKLGYKVLVGANVGKNHGYLAGTDEERLNDLHSMFKNKLVKAIMCVRGGYGSPRLLDGIDYKLIKRNPKIFVGYSDITALQMAFLQKANLVTFAGPMLAVDFHDEVSPFTEEFFWDMITSPKKNGRIENPNNEKLYCLKKGGAKGQIVGGNLALLVSLMGTQYFPDVRNKILFLEDTGEAPYRLDRLFNQLRIAGVFDKVKGIVLGAFTDCKESDSSKKTLTLGEVIEDYFTRIKKPVVYNFQHGHIKDNITVPYGIRAKLNATKGFIEFLEGAVS
ncbi:MAG: LD-carboxypeptidase [Ignavibacteriaceae bacterium]|nr:LD-carboxypeptidase [Ignavibacteriaceae bacterium]